MEASESLFSVSACVSCAQEYMLLANFLVAQKVRRGTLTEGCLSLGDMVMNRCICGLLFMSPRSRDGIIISAVSTEARRTRGRILNRP